ncbi:hypothetical protein ACOSQ2_009798 [Xanthoceras sorbifolium]
MMMSVVRIGTCRGATYEKSGVSRDSVLTIPGRVLEENNRFLGIEDDSSHLKDPPSRPEDNTTLLLGNTSETPCVLADLLSRSIKGKTVAMEGLHNVTIVEEEFPAGLPMSNTGHHHSRWKKDTKMESQSLIPVHDNHKALRKRPLENDLLWLDHRPLLVQIFDHPAVVEGTHGAGSRRFQFKTCWANETACRDLVKARWGVGGPVPALKIVLDRLLACASALHEWNEGRRRIMWFNISRLQRELHEANSMVSAASWHQIRIL